MIVIIFSLLTLFWRKRIGNNYSHTFLWYDASHNPIVFVAAFLSSRCLATIGGYTYRHRLSLSLPPMALQPKSGLGLPNYLPPFVPVQRSCVFQFFTFSNSFASVWTSSIHRFLGLPIGLTPSNLPMITFLGILTHRLMGGIYEVRRWDWLRCHDMHKFRKDWLTHSKVDGGGGSVTQTAWWSHKPTFIFSK
jgi:hypothetical protein